MQINEDTKRMVVKIGTSTLIHKTGKTNIRRIAKLASVLSDLQNAGKEIILVSSGTVGVGVGRLGLKKCPETTRAKQALAAVGQCEMMFLYDKLFSEYGHTVAQLLLTKSDVEDETRCENLVNTFDQLFEYGVIPVVNENGSVTADGLSFDHHDMLPAIVADLVDADEIITM